VEPITIEGIRKTVAAYGPRRLEQRLARYHGAKARDLFFAWSDTWLSESFQNWNIEDCLDRIACPALVMQGREDPYGSERQVQSIVAGIGPKARAMLIPGGHALHRDAPESVRKGIADFVEAL
jgi:pimeloyl-ACP methyl ester carboxylesterase